MLITPEEYHRHNFRERRRKLKPMQRIPLNAAGRIYVGRREDFDPALHFLRQSARYEALDDAEGDGTVADPLGYEVPKRSGWKVLSEQDRLRLKDYSPHHFSTTPPPEATADYLDGMALEFHEYELWDAVIRTSTSCIRLQYLTDLTR